MSEDWLEIQVRERREQQAQLDAELDEIIADTMDDGRPDAPAPAKPEAIAEAGNVIPFRRPTPWPHAWNSPEPWRGKGWNSGKTWSGPPRVLITNRSAPPFNPDDEPPPRAA